MMKYNHNEVLHIIENTRRFGKVTGYEVSKHILDQLGHPEQGMPFVHVAGTNGKGSTTAFLCKLLEQTGKKVGMFTSPHLIEFEERIRINGTKISKEDVTRLGNLLLETEFQLPPTMFDYCLAMAVLYFKEQNCDIVVMETGIGGLYDSTNALGTPEVSIITKIGYDHTAVLGDTLKEIATQKAGIIKKDAPLVHQTQAPEVEGVFKQTFLKKNGSLLGYHVVSTEDIKRIEHIEIKMQGNFQKENAATAVSAFRILLQKWEKTQNLYFTEEQIEAFVQTGLKETLWRGRMEILSEKPFLMVDGAHNGHGVHALAEGLKGLYPGEKFHFIMGVMADKDYENMIEELLPLAIDFVTVTPESSRALQAKELAECIRKKGVPASHQADVKEVVKPFLPKYAKESVLSAQEKEDRTKHESKTIAFGSLYFIGEIESLFLAGELA